MAGENEIKRRPPRLGGGTKLPTEGALTPRERELITLVMEGLDNKYLAERMGISVETVKRHLSNIFSKLGVDTRLQLALKVHAYLMDRQRAAIFIELGLVDLEAKNGRPIEGGQSALVLSG
jgi:DNA-binding NarL/FixJ family response regulator